MKLIFVGAQSTGKSTVLQHYKELGYNVITEVVRNLAQQGINVNEMGDDAGQETIFDTYYELLSQQDDYISDRGLIDVIAYTTYLYEHNKVTKRTLSEQYKQLKTFNENFDDILYVYFPIEFGVVDDGFRSTDEDFRYEIDQNIFTTLLDCEVPYIKVSGSVEERIKIIDMALQVEAMS